MRALAYYGTQTVRFTTDLPEPKIEEPDDVLIDVEWCGICGTDLHEVLDGPNFFPEDGKTHEISGKGLPQAIGHEISGIVTHVGADVKTLKPGDHIVIEPTGTCQDRERYNTKGKTCAPCKKGIYNVCEYLGLCGAGVQSGGCAEKVVIGEKHCFKIPKWIPLDVAALIQPLAVCWHAVKLAKVKAGQTALILGGGPIGLGMILALKNYGCTDIVVSEPAHTRQQLASKMGTRTSNPLDFKNSDENIKYLKSLSADGSGFDFCFDCSGIPDTFEAAIQCLTFRGTAVNVAIWGHRSVKCYPMELTLQEKRYMGAMCYTTEDFANVVDSFCEGRIDPKTAECMITSKVVLENGRAGFMKLLHDKEGTIKVLITPKESLVREQNE